MNYWNTKLFTFILAGSAVPSTYFCLLLLILPSSASTMNDVLLFDWRLFALLVERKGKNAGTKSSVIRIDGIFKINNS